MYLSATELNPNLPSRLQITASTNPAIASGIVQIIAQVSAEIDSAAAEGGYAVPISPTSSPNSYSLLQQFAVYGAGWRALMVQMPNQGGVSDKEQLSSVYRQEYDRAIAMLRAGQLVLTDAPHDTSGTAGGRILPRSYSTSNVGATVGVVPQVTMGRDQF